MSEQRQPQMILPSQALPGRDHLIESSSVHLVLGTPLAPPFPRNTESIAFGMGCFWGTEQIFWQLPGVYTTVAGYAGGFTPNPIYDEILTGKTGHAEVALVVYRPEIVSTLRLIKTFFESHNPTQYLRQGKDRGSHYRSVILCTNESQYKLANDVRLSHQLKLLRAGYGPIRTEIEMLDAFYFAEHFHQQYLSRNPHRNGGQAPLGVACDLGDETLAQG